MRQDYISGGVLLALAAAYDAATGAVAVTESTLSDEIGATGLPRLRAFINVTAGSSVHHMIVL